MMKMKSVVTTVFVLAMTIARGVSFLTTADSTPSVVIIESSLELNMSRLDNNWWSAEVNIEPGLYHYYYSTEDATFLDQRNPDKSYKDGAELSVLRVENLGDLQDFARHSVGDRDYFNPVNENEFYFAVSLPIGTTYQLSLIVDGTRYNLEYLRDFGKDSFYRTDRIKVENLEYYFEIQDGDNSVVLDSLGLCQELRLPFIFEKDRLPITYFDLPEWSKGAVYYQIFPERFANGDPRNDPVGVQPWNSDPVFANLGGDGFFGGDLKGIIDRFDHILELGVNAIYLNPIFESPSSHKYDTEDYLKIDDNFGDDYVFEELISLAEDSGIKLILDGVFNHTGYDFFAFKDLREREETSPYKDWYFVKRFPIRKIQDRAMTYVGWNGYAYMPKINSLNEGWQAYVEQLVRKYDLEGIGGWRLDVATEVDPLFWSDFFRPLVKGLDKEKLLVAEFWGDARALLRGKSFDSVMNYPFKDAVVEYVFRAGNSAAKFAAMTNLYLNAYPPQTLHSLWNILDSHDTERILTLAFNQVDLLKIAVAIQMTFIGSPVIYYGDEIGMKGGKDPENRAPMIWDEERWNWEIYEFYKKLTELRESHESLRTGEYEVMTTNGPVLSYRRWNDQDEVIVVVNPSRESVSFSPSTSGEFFEYLSGRILVIDQHTVEIPAITVWILVRNESGELASADNS